MDALKKQSGYSFVFSSEDVDIKKALEFTKQQGVKVEVIKRGN